MPGGEPLLPEPPRERGWWGLLVALAALLLAPMGNPLLVPVEQTLVLLVPAIAVCALVAWWRGGPGASAILWTALTVWMLRWTTIAGTGAYAHVSWGWSLTLSALFGFVLLAGAPGPFISRALAAVAGTTALAAVVLLLTGTATAALHAIAAHNATLVEANQARWTAAISGPGGPTDPDLRQWLLSTADSLPAFARGATTVWVALLGLESLATLAVAWALHHRLSRTRLGPPLGALTQFRFSDQLVWGLIVGMVILLLPSLSGLQAVGINLVLFFGALYALRGLGVLQFLFNPGIVLRVVFVLLAAMLLFPIFCALVFGVGDTWIDWRSRRPRPTS